MSPRRIRVAGVRGDFLTPRGWPTPTDDWIRENAFWQPPVGWTPLPGLKPAPAGWQFWTTNPTWDAAATAWYAPIRGWYRAFMIASSACWPAFIAAAVFHINALRLAAFVFFLIGFLCLVAYEVRKRRMTAEMFLRVTTGATRRRDERLVREYQSYLRDAA